MKAATNTKGCLHTCMTVELLTQLPILSALIEVGDLPTAYLLRSLNHTFKKAVDNKVVWTALAEKAWDSTTSIDRRQFHLYLKVLTGDTPQDHLCLQKVKSNERTTTDIRWLRDHLFNSKSRPPRMDDNHILYVDRFFSPTLPSLSHFSQVTQLDVRGCPIVEFPESICSLTQLKELCITDCPIIDVPKEIVSLSNLQKLQLQNCSFGKFEESICKLTNLFRLVVTTNGLINVPSIEKLSKLRELNLSNNLLTQLHLNAAYLSEVDLSRNQFGSWPLSFNSLSHLSTLRLDRNKLTSLEGINSLSLKSLVFSHNCLTRLPDSFTSLHNLNEIYLDHNQFKIMPACLFKMESLTCVALTQNFIWKLPEIDTCLLKDLYLGGNRLTRIPRSITKLTALRTLGLMRNPLIFLPANGLLSMTQLKVLCIDNPLGYYRTKE